MKINTIEIKLKKNVKLVIRSQLFLSLNAAIKKDKTPNANRIIS
jgi:hypothetical protein